MRVARDRLIFDTAPRGIKEITRDLATSRSRLEWASSRSGRENAGGAAIPA
jgi:hypothetical protein